MITVNAAADDTITFLWEKGFCPKKVGKHPMGGAIMIRWVQREETDEGVIHSLGILEVLGGTSFKKGEDCVSKEEKEGSCPCFRCSTEEDGPGVSGEQGAAEEDGSDDRRAGEAGEGAREG
jgi:hypothetical protein